MGKALDLTGQQFGRLTVDEFAGTIGDTRDNNRKRYWYCTCECGIETLVSTGDLRSGKTKSCGCLHDEVARERKLVHGGCLNRRQQGASVEFTAWANMRNKDPYPDNWNDFQQFFRDVGWRPDDTYKLSRYDLTQPHGPDNTYWRNPNEERAQRINTDLGDELLIDLTGVREPDAFARAPT